MTAVDTLAPPERPVAKQGTREIVVESLGKQFDDQVVLNDISFAVDAGEMVAIVGESGGGKSVLFDVITGMIPADGGRVLVADHSEPEAPLVDFLGMEEEDRARIRRYWGEVFQRNALFSGTVYENIALWFRSHSRLKEREIRKRARESLEAVNLDVDDVIDKPRDSLSGGMAKRVAIARAIAIEPTVIFYDEPTTGLDPMTVGIVHELICRLHTQAGPKGRTRTSVLVTHDTEMLRKLAPRVIMLHDRQVCFDGSFESFVQSENACVRRYLESMPTLHARVRGCRG